VRDFISHIIIIITTIISVESIALKQKIRNNKEEQSKPYPSKSVLDCSVRFSVLN
jgi:hypothetical protein